MDTAWILVAHRSGAKIFEHRRKELNLLREVPHAENKTQGKEAAGADKAERNIDRPGKARRQFAGRELQKALERETMRFVRELAGMLEDGRVHQRYNKLVLVAESRLLGELRAVLTPETNALISTTQRQDLAWMDTQEMKKYLQDITWPPPRLQ